MKKLIPLLITAIALPAAAAQYKPRPPKKDHAPVPLTKVTTTATTTTPTAGTSQQKVWANNQSLVSPEQAQAIIQRFKTGYAKMGNPRIMIYVNRNLVDTESGFMLASRTETTATDRSTTNSKFESDANAPKAGDGRTTITAQGDVTINGAITQGLTDAPGTLVRTTLNENAINKNTFNNNRVNHGTLADRQTVRDVERLFGRPLRHGGAKLADQRVATQMIASRNIQTFALTPEGDQARKDREALSKITDVVLEILISSRSLKVARISGTETLQVPDIQATAINLKDSSIIGQATASDVLGQDRYAGRIARNFGIPEITEATALALMEDMMIGVE
ncbi:hypothetical protein N9B94_04475 [Verrucomicrobia bacterium]|nr:hypothetical protein [Verrucomicrobiota bacterium]